MAVRTLRVNDAEPMLQYFGELVRSDPERVERLSDVERITLENEKAWIMKRLDDEENKEMFVLIAESEGKIVAEGEIERRKRWIERHVAEIRFGVLPGYEHEATEIVHQLSKQAKNNGIEILLYFHLASQQTGLNIMRSAGFEEWGKVNNYYKRDSEYIDRIYLMKRL